MKKRHSNNAIPNAIGELELRILEIVWLDPGVDAREITVSLPATRTISLSTVQSTLERLTRKNLLTRVKHSHAYRYCAAVTRGELLGAMLKDVISLLHNGNADTILSSFVNVAAKLDDTALDELEALIQKKRQSEEDRHG
jgi:predicted transcriptional regulator